MRNSTRELDDLETPRQLATGIREHLAMLERYQLSELLSMRLNELLEAEHDARAL
jgi:hypothetical protein